MAKSKKAKALPANYLDFIPCRQEKIQYEIDGEGKVIILQENRGFFNFLAQTFFHKPKVSQIHLDDMGNFIWPLLDGTRSIMDISVLVKENFGEKAEPLYNRLVQYLRTLESYGFIKILEQPGNLTDR